MRRAYLKKIITEILLNEERLEQLSEKSPPAELLKLIEKEHESRRRDDGRRGRDAGENE